MKVPLLFMLALLAWPLHAADSFPTRPIRIVVPFPPGSTTDAVARTLSDSVSRAIHQTIIVDNKAGADGAIAAAEVAKAAPDGLTLLMATNSPMAVVPAMRKKLSYDPLVDFTPITDVGRYTLFLYAHPDVPAKTFVELMAYAKAHPDKLTFATVNTSGIVWLAQVSSAAGVRVVHVPYKGEPAGMTDLVGGNVQLMLGTAASASVEFVKSGKLRALATTLPKRSTLLPEVPTMAEVGLPQLVNTGWVALFGPAKVPRDIVERLNAEFVGAMGKPQVQAAMEKQGIALTPSSPDQLGQYLKDQVESYRRILRAAGIEPE